MIKKPGIFALIPGEILEFSVREGWREINVGLAMSQVGLTN